MGKNGSQQHKTLNDVLLHKNKYHKNDELSQTLAEVLGKDLSNEVIDYLAAAYPKELANPGTRLKFANLVKNPPAKEGISEVYSQEAQQFGMVAAALKVASVKALAAKQGNVSKGQYSDFNHVIDRILPATKEIADDFNIKMNDPNNMEEALALTKTPVYTTHTLIYNEYPERVEKAEKNPSSKEKTASEKVIERVTTSLGSNEKDTVKNFNLMCDLVMESSKEKAKDRIAQGENMPETVRVQAPEERKNYWTRAKETVKSLLSNKRVAEAGR